MKPGDRLRLSALGLTQIPELSDKTGTVIEVGVTDGIAWVDVAWDGEGDRACWVKQELVEVVNVVRPG